MIDKPFDKVSPQHYPLLCVCCRCPGGSKMILVGFDIEGKDNWHESIQLAGSMELLLDGVVLGNTMSVPLKDVIRVDKSVTIDKWKKIYDEKETA